MAVVWAGHHLSIRVLVLKGEFSCSALAIESGRPCPVTQSGHPITPFIRIIKTPKFVWTEQIAKMLSPA